MISPWVSHESIIKTKDDIWQFGIASKKKRAKTSAWVINKGMVKIKRQLHHYVYRKHVVDNAALQKKDLAMELRNFLSI
jgi:NAD(P)H-nitrite reductase large subunit